MIPDRSSPSRLRFAAPRPGVLRADPKAASPRPGNAGEHRADRRSTRRRFPPRRNSSRPDCHPLEPQNSLALAGQRLTESQRHCVEVETEALRSLRVILRTNLAMTPGASVPPPITPPSRRVPAGRRGRRGGPGERPGSVRWFGWRRGRGRAGSARAAPGPGERAWRRCDASRAA